MSSTKSKQPSLLEEYFAIHDEYTEKFGDNVLVMLQKGDFYEIYEYDMEGCKKGKCKEISSMTLNDPDFLQPLRITMSYPNKPHDTKNPYMVGVPVSAFNKWKRMFLAKDYIVVKVDQFTPQGGGRKIRKVTEVISVGTDMNSYTSVSSNVVCVFIMCEDDKDTLVTIGMSSIDLVSGKSCVKESYSTKEQPHSAIESLEKFLISQRPKEVIIYLQDFKNPQRYFRMLDKTVGFSAFDKVHFYPKIEPPFCKIPYQEKMLNKVFKIESTLSPLDVLDFSKIRYATTSYVALLQFCYEYNERIVSKIERPVVEKEGVRMLIPSNTIAQLNLLSNNQLELHHHHKGVNSLFAIVNFTRTSMGKRYLKEMMMRPLIDSKEINGIYDKVSGWLENKDLLESVDEHLKKIPDLERYLRRIVTSLIQPYELSSFVKGYYEIVKIINLMIRCKFVPIRLSKDAKKKVGELANLLRKTIDLEALRCTKLVEGVLEFSQPPFKNVELLDVGLEKEYTEGLKVWQESIDYLQKKREEFDAFLENERVNFDFVDDLYRITTNKTRADKLKKQFNLKSQPSKANRTEVYNDEMLTYSNNASKAKERLEKLFYKMYNSILEKISEFEEFSNIIKFVTIVDYTTNIAKCTVKHKYFRPTLVESKESFFDAVDIRHPLIERIIDEEYVVNDLALGSITKGMMLYGPNSIGKTSLAKAIGTIVVLAQMGYYVPCKLKYSPYKTMLTRLSGNDNIYKGHSSFVVEMMEMRTILKNANSNALVLGDELCRGTESISGTSIAISAVISLLKKKSTFIFATHMHHIPTNKHVIPLVESNQLTIKHLQIVYDHQLKTLIFDRKLKDGSGDPIYGLEIAKSLDLDDDFLDLANEVRKEICEIPDKIVAQKTSRYNSTVYVDKCNMCGKKSDLHSHHIKEQQDADELDYIGHVPKNASYNLVIVCQSCHHKTHCEKINIQKKMTTKGIQILIS